MNTLKLKSTGREVFFISLRLRLMNAALLISLDFDKNCLDSRLERCPSGSKVHVSVDWIKVVQQGVAIIVV